MGNALSIDSETAKAWKEAADKTAREEDDAERWAKIVNEEREAASKALGEKLKKLKKEEEDKKKKKEEEAKMKKKGEEERKKEERRRKATEVSERCRPEHRMISSQGSTDS